jgi:hypothetical protein
MSRTHSIIFSALLVAASFGSVAGQRRERIPPPRDQQFYEPRNKLEEFESRLGTLLIKGHTYVATLKATGGGSARVEAIEIRDTGNSTRITGVVVTIAPVEQNGPTLNEIRSLIDYEDIDRLIKAFDTAAKADESLTKLTHFEVRYRIRGDFEIVVFKQVSGGVAAAVEGGFFERKRLLLTLDEFVKLRWMIAQAKDRLDEIPVP